MGARAAVACLVLGIAACGGKLDLDIPADAAIDAPPPPPPVVPVAHVHSWPGMGVQLVVEVPDRVTAEAQGGLPEAWLETDGGQRIDAQVAPAGVTTGSTAVLVLPSPDPTIHAARLAAADQLLQKLPAQERVALYAVEADHAVLLSDMQIPREHARARLAELEPSSSTNAVIALREVRGALDGLQSAFGDDGRAAIVVGEAAEDDPPEVRRTVQVLSMTGDGDPAAAAASTVAQLAARRAALVRIGACPTFAENEPFELHLGSGHADDLFAPEVMDHVAGEPCDAAKAAADDYPYPSEIDLTFTPEQRAAYDQAFNSQNENVDWQGSIKLGVGTPIAFTGHLHGQGTLGCARKSYNVELDDGKRRRLMPGLAGDQILLVSMCEDDSYFGQVFADRLMARLDLFKPSLRFVKLTIDGVNRGVYLLMDQPEHSIRDNGLGIESVIRRRYDIDNQPAEVKYPTDPAIAATEASYFETLGDFAMTGPPDMLDGELGRRMDLDGYLRLLAIYSLLQNGDYIDEYWFFGSQEPGGEYYRMMGWDTDDTFSACHGGGGRGIVDRCMLTYCAEAELDHSLLRSPAIYNRFLLGMDRVLTEITPELMMATMAQVKSELWAVLDDDATAQALVEIGSPATV
ncbi:MAG TPA: CotH kinase family protein, partial [Kofleriaceae bacterium]|nr:CotH kinase family protein [Kofleriaceae bacterium]